MTKGSKDSGRPSPVPSASRTRGSIPREAVTGAPPRPGGSGVRGSGVLGSGQGPVVLGFLVALGFLAAQFLAGLLSAISSVLLLVTVAFFLAVGLDPAVRLLGRRGLRRPWAVLVVACVVLVALTLFVFALVPVITDQVATIVDNAPGWLESLHQNRQIQELDDQYHVIEKSQEFLTSGDWASGLFGGVIGIGLAVLGFLANAFVVTVLTLYFLASLRKTKDAMYQLVPASRRDRVEELTERILTNVGGYVSGAFVVAMCAGISSLIFLFVIGLAEYAVALAAVVALLDVIPMIGATIGAVIVTAIGFATDVRTGVACLIFYLIYQQLENYVLYPRVMQRTVNVPGLVTVIAALVGAALLGVVGALLAIPTAAAILLLVREVWLPRQALR